MLLKILTKVIVMYKAVLSRKDITAQTEYYGFIKDILCDTQVQQMVNFRHHKGTTRLQHSLNVSYYNYKVCKFLKLDARSAARAGLLHDFFLHDWRTRTPVEGEGWHGVGHPKVALSNASEQFSINAVEGDMILNHMWPLSPRLPRYRETYIIQLVDKFCAAAEVMTHLCSEGRYRLQPVTAFAVMLLIKLNLK